MTIFSYLTVPEVIILHEETLAVFGGLPGIKDRGLLESAVYQPRMILFGQAVYKTAHEIAAAYCFYIIKNHAFLDGNKRTGALAMLTFLARNQKAISITPDDLYQLALAVATSHLNLEQVAQFLELRLEQNH